MQAGQLTNTEVDHGTPAPSPLGSLGQMECGGRSTTQGLPRVRRGSGSLGCGPMQQAVRDVLIGLKAVTSQTQAQPPRLHSGPALSPPTRGTTAPPSAASPAT